MHAFAVILHVLELSALASAACTSFIPNGPGFKGNDTAPPQYISAGVVCTNATASLSSLCPTKPGCSVMSNPNDTIFGQGTITFAAPDGGSTNATATSDELPSLFSLLPEVNSSNLGGVYNLKPYISGQECGGVGFCTAPGQSGALAFSPAFVCFQGALICDAGGSIPNNTVATMCGAIPVPTDIRSNNGGPCGPVGAAGFQNLSAAQAANMTTDPASMVSGAGALRVDRAFVAMSILGVAAGFILLL